jgi:hypothetical protein
LKLTIRPAEKSVAPDAYQAEHVRLVSVRWLAFFLGLAVLFSLGPVAATMNFDLRAAPAWAQWAVALALLQGIYIVWMLAAADFASVWVVMVVFTLVSAVYAAATGITLATPLDRPMLLDLGQYRDQAPSWSGAVLLVMALATYLAGRTATRWRRAYELESAARGQRRSSRQRPQPRENRR